MKVLRNPEQMPSLVWIFVVQMLLCWSCVFTTDCSTNCVLPSGSDEEKTALCRLFSLNQKEFSVDVPEEKEKYTYTFKFCGDAGGIPGAGVIQKATAKPPKVIGRYNSTEAYGGSDWVMLIYKNGDVYDSHCSNEKRKAIIMISCNRETNMGNFEVIREDRSKTSECFYLFELDSSGVCPPIESHLSAGSIILIIAFCLLAVYLLGGFLYQRLIVGAKGMEQFPNYAFWVEVGNLAADGCDFVCRTRNREEAPAYRGVTTDALEEEPEERDDHLLPM